MLRAVSCGTEMTIEQAGLPEMFPLDACYLGWQQSVEKLIAFLGPNLGE